MRVDADAIIFDFGGTLDTDGVHWSEVYWEELSRAHPGLDKGACGRAFVAASERLVPELPLTGGLRAILEREVDLQWECLGLGGGQVGRRAIVEACAARVRAKVEHTRGLVEGWARRRPLAVLSNFYGNLSQVLVELDLARFFSVCVDSVAVGLRKPDPAIFELTLDRLGSVATRVAMVGDSYENDIAPAKQVGCQTIWLRGRSWTLPATTTSADRIISTLAEIET